MATSMIMDESVLGNARQVLSMITKTSYRHRIWKYVILITIIMFAGTVATVRLIDWQRDITDAIGTRDLAVFARQVETFAIIASVLLCLRVVQAWLQERLKVHCGWISPPVYSTSGSNLHAYSLCR